LGVILFAQAVQPAPDPAPDVCEIAPDTPACQHQAVVQMTGPLRAAPAYRIEPIPDPPPVEVMIRARPPARSASDWVVDGDVLSSLPRGDGADVLGELPGVY